MNHLLLIMGRDIRLALRHGGAGGMVLAFFIIMITLFAFAVGPDPKILRTIAVGVIWVGALLSCLLSLERIFQSDYEDGSLDQLLLSPLPLELVVVAKCLSHWLTTALPLILMTPLLGVMMNLSPGAYVPLIYSMLLGTPALSFIGGMGASLILTLKRGGALLSLLILPLYIPVLIFGVLAVESVVAGSSPRDHLMLLTGFSLFSMALTPWAAAAAIRSGIQ